MTDIYRVERSHAGGYTVRRTDHSEEFASGVMSAVGWGIGLVVAGIGAAAQAARDRQMQLESQAMEEAYRRNDFPRLLALSDAFVHKHPEQAHARAFLALALIENGLFARALSELDRAASAGLDRAQVCVLRAAALSRKGDLAGVLAEFSDLMSDERPHVRRQGFLGRANALLEIGDSDLALSDVDRAIAQLPDHTAYACRARVRLAMGEGAKALADYTRAVILAPSDQDILESRAAVFEQMGMHEQAAADRSTASELRARQGSTASQSGHISDTRPGTPVTARERRCPSCGYVVSNTALRCLRCDYALEGVPLAQTEPDSAPESQPSGSPQPAVPTAPPTSRRRCSKCGSEVSRTAIRCLQCNQLL